MTAFPSSFSDSIQFEELFDHAGIGIARVAVDGNWLGMNSALCQIVGYSKDELRHLTFQDVTHPDNLESDQALVKQMMTLAKQGQQLEKRCLHKSGHIIWVNITVSLVADTSCHPAYLIVVFEDITDLKINKSELKKEKTFILRAVNCSLAGIYIYNIKQGKNEFINQTYTDITGHTRDELNQLNPEEFSMLFHDDDREAVFKHMDDVVSAMDDSYFEIEYRFKSKQGDWIWCLSRDRVFSWDENHKAESFIGTFIDITKIKKMEGKLKEQAQLDYLTGVDNRRSLNEKLNAEFNRSQRYSRSFSLMMIDVDSFKDVNDTYGHSVGDDVLVSLTQKIKQTVRDSDTVARYGGDEFIVMLPETGRDQALFMAERIRDEFGKSAADLFKGKDEKTTISVGIATLDAGIPSAEALIKYADKALYKAKAAGRNNVK